MISSICPCRNGPRVRAAAFSSACATVRKPGIGTVRPLRAHSQPSAPCARVRPSAVSTSRTASTRFTQCSDGTPPSSNQLSQAGGVDLMSPASARGLLPRAPARRPMAKGLRMTLIRPCSSLRSSIPGASSSTLQACWTAAQC